MRSGKQSKQPRRSTAKKGGEAAETSAGINVAQSSQDGSENPPKRAKKSNSGLKINEKQPCRGSRLKFDFEIGAKENDKLKSLIEESKDSDDSDWEDGLIQVSNPATDDRNSEGNVFTVELPVNPESSDRKNIRNSEGNVITVELPVTPESSNRKNIRRFTAEEKETAELIHRVHLLCLIGRGRIIDRACDDPLIQAAFLSQLPPYLLKISEATKLTVKALSPLVTWLHKHFRVRSTTEGKPFPSALSLALGTQEGSPEEVAALSVALFRALNLSARFVSVLDVASLKPGTEKPNGEAKDIFDSSTLMVAGSSQLVKCSKLSLSRGKRRRETSGLDLSKLKTTNMSRKSETEKSKMVDNMRMNDQSAAEARSQDEHGQCLKRKGDLEFELQMEMALASTAAAMPNLKSESNVDPSQAESSSVSTPLKNVKTEGPSSSSQDISTAIGCHKVGAPLCWAEVYCDGENKTGKWVHVDVVNALIDGEMRVEPATSACKKSLRYVVAFAGNGAKDVTRRYCAEWYKISPKRVNSMWWDGVLAPLKQLESGTSGGIACADPRKIETESSILDIANRASLEDMELETRALTEPLPTNQQAYRSHSLYAIEKWLTKYQILYPKGPVLGLVSGHQVYPRSCVQTLHTRERWLREALQVRADELPVKIIKSITKHSKGQTSEVDDPGEVGLDGTVPLYGKWQTEPLHLQPAVNGIVPKNERGQVDVWSEKCLPPGTVHLRLPRLVPIVERLGINFAPAMVGFEFRNGRSVPVYEGLVVCTEFKDAILEVYAAEEERRQEEERKRDERQALSRWYQLLSSIITRQRLTNTYGPDSSRQTPIIPPKSDDIPKSKVDSAEVRQSTSPRQEIVQETQVHVSAAAPTEEHRHVFVVENETLHEADGTLIRTKRCDCGFVVQVEEL